MRRILSEDEVSAGINHKKSRNVEATPYAPNYHGVNQILFSPSGSGRVSFLGALGQMSTRAVEERQRVYDRLEVTDILSRTDAQFANDQRDFMHQNPSGKGYTEYSTGRYSQLQDVALEQASNSEVQNSLKMIFASRSADIANQAFKAENEMFAAYTINDVDEKINVTLNDVMTSPGSVISLRNKLDLQLSSMQAVLSPEQFLKYANEKSTDFTYCYGLGLIRQDPFTAETKLIDERFKNLPPKKLDFLRKLVALEKDSANKAAEKEELMKARAIERDQDMAYLQFQVAIANGDFDKSALEAAYEAGTITKEHKLKLELKMAKATKIQQEENAANIAIKAAIDAKIPTNGVSAKDKTRYLDQEFELRNTMKMGAGLSSSSFTAKVQYLQENAVVFDCAYHKLCSEAEANVRYGKDATRVMDTCVALSGNEIIPALSAVSDEIRDFSKFAVVKYRGKDSLTEILEERDRFFNVSEDFVMANKARWRDIAEGGDEYERRDNITKDFYKKNGYKSWFRVDSAIRNSQEKDIIDAQIYSIIHRVFERTGSMTTAHAVANEWFKSAYVKSDVNGDEVFMLNPPTEGNTGLDQRVISNIISLSAEKAVARANMAGTSIKAKGKFTTAAMTPAGLKTGKPSSANMTVLVDIEGRGEERKLYVSAASATEPVYNFYYLLDESDPNSREYLLGRDGTRTTLNFDTAKRYLRSRNE